MRDDIAIWNILHDGCLVEAKDFMPGDVHVRVEIPYLCRVLSPSSDSVWVFLHGCSLFQFRQWSVDTLLTALSEIEAASPEILSANEEDGHVCVTCVDGVLEVCYERVSFKLDNDCIVSFQELDEAARLYWQR